MSTDVNLIREITTQIVSEQLLTNWKFYAVLVALQLIVSVVGSFITSYFKTRGQHLATQADLNRLLDQMKQTTATVEAVKSEISQLEWRKKESNIVRRTKLEELLTLVYELHHWLDTERNATFFEGKVNERPSPINKIEGIGVLFFPELSHEIRQLQRAVIEHGKWIIGGQREILEKKRDGVASPVISQTHADAHALIYGKYLESVGVLEKKAAALMDTILNT